MVSSSRRDQAADDALDLVGGARGFLDAGAGGHAHVQADLAAIHVGEEVAPEDRIEQAGQQAERQEAQREAAAVRQQRGQHQRIAAPHPLEAVVEGAVQTLQQAAWRCRPGHGCP
jgi:hypothetical protein